MQLMLMNRGGGVDTTDANATKAQVLTGYSVYVNELKVNGAMPNHGAISYRLPANGTYTVPAGFHNGSGKVTQSLTTQGGSTITPGTSKKLAVSSGRYVTGNIWAAGASTLVAGNIKENVNIFGVKGSFVGVNCRDANATKDKILNGYTGYVNQAKVTGTMPNRGSVGTQWLPANGTYTVANGWHNGHGVVKQSLTTQAGVTITPGTSNKIAVSSGRYVTGTVWAAGDSKLVAGNIKENVDIFGVKGSFVGVDCRDANGRAEAILDGYVGYVNQTRIVGTMPNRGSVGTQWLPVNGTFNIENGYHNGQGVVKQSITTQGASTITPGPSRKLAVPAGRYTTGNIYTISESALRASNIKKGVTIFGVTGTYGDSGSSDSSDDFVIDMPPIGLA